MTSSSITPTALKKIGNQAMKISWSDGKECEYSALTLRSNCKCASCRNEITGEQILKADSLPKDITITKSEVVGNYALGFAFSDGHATGIYTFDHLKELCAK